MSERLKNFFKGCMYITGLFVVIVAFYYAQELRHYRYVEHEAAMAQIAAASQCQQQSK